MQFCYNSKHIKHQIEYPFKSQQKPMSFWSQLACVGMFLFVRRGFISKAKTRFCSLRVKILLLKAFSELLTHWFKVTISLFHVLLRFLSNLHSSIRQLRQFRF